MGTLRQSITAMARRLRGTPPGRAALRDLTTTRATPTLGDEQMALLWTPVTPERARAILEDALRGDVQRQEELFRLMLDSWPRLAKATGEVCRAVSRLAYGVAAPEGASPYELAQAELVERSLRAWRPRPGTMELGLEETLDALVMARHTGLSVLELHWQRTAHGLLPRAAWLLGGRHVAWNEDGTELGLRTGEETWASFDAAKFLVGAWRSRPGAPVATAMLRALVPYWVGRTYGYQWLMQFAQLFGLPLRWANYDESRPETGVKVAEMLRNLGSAGWAAFPSGVEMKLVEPTGNARDNPQLILQELADEACDLLILGQTLSGTSASTGLGSGTAVLHGQVRREVITGAAQWVADVLNYQLVPALVELNFGAGADPAQLPIVTPDLSSPADPKAEAERLEILVRSGLRVPAAWVYASHGIPAPERDDEVLGPATPAQPPKTPAGGAATPGEGKEPGEDEKTNLRSAAEGPRGSLRAARANELAGNLFEELTGVTRRWLGPVEGTLTRLLALAEAEAVTEADFASALAETRSELPELFDDLDHGALETALRRVMAPAVVNGAGEREAEA